MGVMGARTWTRCAAAAAVLALGLGCANDGSGTAKPSSGTAGAAPTSTTTGGSSSGKPSVVPTVSGVAVPKPGAFTGATTSPDLLVTSEHSIDAATVAKIRQVPGVTAAEPISLATFYVAEQAVTYAAVDPDTFRKFTPPGTAQTAAVWDRVAGGEIAVQPSLGRELQQKDGYMRLGNEDDSPRVHIGAYAEILNPMDGGLSGAPARINAVVNHKYAAKLDMREHNALVISTGATAPRKALKAVQQLAGADAGVQILSVDVDLKALQTAILTGGSVARAVGSFSYRANPDGTVVPDARWVAANIRTEMMPIIGRVTGHQVMLPQLRAALNEIVALKLSSSIYHYDGCYVPRFIAKDPAKGLSFHTFGTAIDLNAADNYRGISGKMDRRVVAIFKRWGFAWGGDWGYTDPMHFELARLVKVG